MRQPGREGQAIVRPQRQKEAKSGGHLYYQFLHYYLGRFCLGQKGLYPAGDGIIKDPQNVYSYSPALTSVKSNSQIHQVPHLDSIVLGEEYAFFVFPRGQVRQWSEMF